jgi:hypothetical protein
MHLTKKEFGVVLLTTLVLFLIALIGLETGLAYFRPSPDERDPLLGWKLKENFRRQFTQQTLGGQDYPVSFATNGHGLRVSGNDEKAPIRIFVLGDSFTADPYASNDRMWYAKMTERLAERTHRPLNDFYVLAGGGGGWGTYQELLLSRQLSGTLKPSLFILEFCSNDFQNNSYEWESQGVVRGQYMRRPFARMDSETPTYAPGLLAALYRSFIGETRLFTRIDAVIGTMQFRRYGGYIRPLPADVAQKYERDSVALTRGLLAKLRAVYRDVPAIMLNCDGVETGPNRQWKILAREAGFVPISGPSDFLRSVSGERRRTVFHADGSHLSDEGNQLYGAVAGDEIAMLGLIPPATP